ILRAICEHGRRLDSELDELRYRELIDSIHRSAELEYMFKHAVVQEVVYGTIFLERRRQLHLAVAQGLEELFKDRLEPHYGVLAFHFVRAEHWQKAHTYLLLAADHAQRLAGDSEALACFEQALAMLDQ